MGPFPLLWVVFENLTSLAYGPLFPPLDQPLGMLLHSTMHLILDYAI